MSVFDYLIRKSFHLIFFGCFMTQFQMINFMFGVSVFKKGMSVMLVHALLRRGSCTCGNKSHVARLYCPVHHLIEEESVSEQIADFHQQTM